MADIPEVDLVDISAPARGLPATLDWLARGANRAVRAANVALLHCPAFVTPYRSPVPVVITIHDTALRRHPEDHPLEWRLYERFSLPTQARRAGRVIVPSEAARRRVVRDLRLPDEQVVAIHLGVAEPFFVSLHLDGVNPARSQPPVMLFPGTPIRRKNLDLVLDALEHAAPGTKLQQAGLWISGSVASDYPHYAERIAHAGLTDRVVWLGRVPFDELPALYGKVDLVVYPSLEEGFGLPPLEAMAAGTPVVASNWDSLVEVLGDAALLIDPRDTKAFSDAAEAVLARPQLAAALVESGVQVARRYTWERCARRTVDVYTEAVDRRPELTRA
jgi:glycosyltransferase involved in cell wall biosynthesis